MAIDRSTNYQKNFSQNHIGNLGFDTEFQMPMTEQLGYDGQSLLRQPAVDMQHKIIEAGGYTYICQAAVGTAEAEDKWKIYRVDSIGNVQYADADSDYDNVATDPSSLTYSYS